MKATVIRLPEEELEFYKELARERKESLAEFFRKAARKEAGMKKKGTKKYSIWNLGTKVVAKKGPKDGSVNHDKYYYDFSDKKRR